MSNKCNLHKQSCQCVCVFMSVPICLSVCLFLFRALSLSIYLFLFCSLSVYLSLYISHTHTHTHTHKHTHLFLNKIVNLHKNAYGVFLLLMDLPTSVLSTIISHLFLFLSFKPGKKVGTFLFNITLNTF